LRMIARLTEKILCAVTDALAFLTFDF